MVFKMGLLLVLEKRYVLETILRLFEVMKMIIKKCIRIVKGTSNLKSTMYADFVIKRLYRHPYTICPI